MSAKYNMWNERAEAEIKRVKYQYTNNLIYTYAEPTENNIQSDLKKAF